MQIREQIRRWKVEIGGTKDDLEIRYSRDGKQIYAVSVVNMAGGVIYKIIDYTKYVGIQLTQSVINPWEKSTADVVITLDRGGWLGKVCDAYAHFPDLTLHSEAAVGNIVVKLGSDVYCVKVLNKKRIRLLNYMLRAISQSIRYDTFLLKHEVTWYADKLSKYFNAINELNKMGIRGTEHLKAIERAIFA